MSLLFAAILLLFIYVLWKLFIDGWLFKIILFFAGWFGLYVACRVYVDGATKIALTINAGEPISFTWAAVIPTAVCFLALLCTKVYDE